MLVSPSAWWPPGVRVKLLVRKAGRCGRVVVGEWGRKRIRWSRDWGGMVGGGGGGLGWRCWMIGDGVYVNVELGVVFFGLMSSCSMLA